MSASESGVTVHQFRISVFSDSGGRCAQDSTADDRRNSSLCSNFAVGGDEGWYEHHTQRAVPIHDQVLGFVEDHHVADSLATERQVRSGQPNVDHVH
eukprot:3623852-Rhodomonas_salina.2